LKLAVPSKHAAEDFDNRDLDVDDRGLAQHHGDAEEGKFNTCLFVAPFYLASYM
jgi:hypothetical protein